MYKEIRVRKNIVDSGEEKGEMFIYKDTSSVKVILVDLEPYIKDYGYLDILGSGSENGYPNVSVNQDFGDGVIEFMFDVTDFLEGWTAFMYVIYKKELHITFTKD